VIVTGRGTCVNVDPDNLPRLPVLFFLSNYVGC
jgi:hypothetical protein